MSDEIEAALEGAKRPEKTVPLCLRGDLQGEWETLERQLRDARRNAETDARLTGNSEPRRLAEQLDKLTEQMHESTVTFRLRGLSRTRYHNLLTAHPPTQGDEDEQMLGFAPVTFWPDLVRACTVAPEVTERQWARLLGGTWTDDKGNAVEEDGTLTAGQFEKLREAAAALNVRAPDVPFSSAASEILRTSAGA